MSFRLFLAAPQVSTIFAQRNSMFAAAVTHATLYGFSVPLFLTCIVVKQRQCDANNKNKCLGRYLIAYTILLFFVSTSAIVAHLQFFRLTLVTHADNPKFPSVLDTPLHMINNLLLGLGAILGDAIMIWRCYIVWARRCGVIIIPTLLTLGTLTSAIAWTVYIAKNDAKAFVNLGIVLTSLSVSTNILVTALIAARILWTSRHLKGILTKEQLKPYNSAVGIIVESAALYSASGLVFIVTLALGIPAEQVTVSIYSIMPYIASYLIIIRVGLGLGIRENSGAIIDSMVFRSSPEDNQATHELRTIRTSLTPDAGIRGDSLTLDLSAPKRIPNCNLDPLDLNDEPEHKFICIGCQNDASYV